MRGAVVAVIVAGARAEVRTNTVGKVKIDIPSSWTVTSDSKVTGLTVGESKDKAVGLMFWVLDKHDTDAALKQLAAALEGKMTEAKWGKPEQADIHGLKGIRNAGTAKLAGKDAVVMVAAVGPTPSGKGVLMFGAIDAGKLKQHEAEVKAVFDSLARAK